jgi:hypothetical protein
VDEEAVGDAQERPVFIGAQTHKAFTGPKMLIPMATASTDEARPTASALLLTFGSSGPACHGKPELLVEEVDAIGGHLVF